ncbi:hypothetical protein P3T76_015806 [Phytophthora citrophthora]|uniref:Uncharacterized protein n=1 Tax=Phytophthora citrophthora TaxID=4793 RepID=A0AAD9L9Z6_9STRA|nr:hypothetical protein P3T76_015806 [Phytophthora citrophthora]
MFTKALGPQRFEKLREGLGVRDVKGVYMRLGVDNERQKDEDMEDRSHDGKGAGWLPSVKVAKCQESKTAVRRCEPSTEDRHVYMTEADEGWLGADRRDTVA